jgi:hypothetical protein
MDKLGERVIGGFFLYVKLVQFFWREGGTKILFCYGDSSPSGTDIIPSGFFAKELLHRGTIINNSSPAITQ